MNKTTNKYTSEVRERAVLNGVVQHESRRVAIVSIPTKISCAPQTLNEWVKKVAVDTGQRGGITTEMAEKMKAQERENPELKQANEILRKASAYFAPLSHMKACVAVQRDGARSPVQEIIRFINDHRADHGVEPICRGEDRTISRQCRGFP